MRTIIAAATAILSLCGCAPKPHEVTQAEVDAFLERKAGARAAADWRWYLATHPEQRYRDLTFPEVHILDEAMWDWTDHAAIKGEKRHWFWEDQSNIVMSPLMATGMTVYATTATTGTSYTGTCTQYPMQTFYFQ